MRISAFQIKFKQIIVRKKFLVNLGLVFLLVLVVVGGYFLGKRIPSLDLSTFFASLNFPQKETAQVQPSGVPQEGKVESVLPKNYEEEAKPGEGITHLARRALKEYLTEKGQNLNLTPEHKVFIEDYLQKKTGDYWLQVGQKLTFSEELIKEAIEKAQGLTQEQLQNLTQYSQLVPELNY
jgi:hypothetical protein